MEANNNPAAEPDDPVLADGWYRMPPDESPNTEWVRLRGAEQSESVTLIPGSRSAGKFHAYDGEGYHRGAHATLAEAKAAALKGA